MFLVRSAPHPLVNLTKGTDPPQQLVVAFRRDHANGPLRPLCEAPSGSHTPRPCQVEEEHTPRGQSLEDALEDAAEGGWVMHGCIVEHLTDRGGGGRLRQAHVKD